VGDYRLRIEVQELSTELWFSAEYWSFTVGDETNSKYRLDVAGYSGDAGDAVENDGGSYNSNGMSFSTYDQDNDQSPGGDCAALFGPWWHNDCFRACLTGIPTKHKWVGLPNDYLLSTSRMMIKPQQ